ncbi:MAG TPA: site-specific tyrosine recombinase XerD, partial [Desulfobacterales bacterium]|nr:site-specific tyrosine recombinase XerD [Desulfobacterales bacterium]
MQFLDRLEQERGCSPNTIRAYRVDLCQFFDFLISNGRISGY